MKAWFCVITALISTANAFEQEVLSEQGVLGTLRRYNVAAKQAKDVLAAAQAHQLDIWGVTKSYVDIYWPSNAASQVPPGLEGVPHTTRIIPAETRHRNAGAPDWNLTSLVNSTFHEVYHPLEETDEFMRQLEHQFPNVTQLTRIGLSAQGRDVFALTIGKKGSASIEQADGKKKKKKAPGHHHPKDYKYNIVVVGAQHGREWIATSTSLYLAHALAVNSTSEPHSLSALLDVFNFHFIPSPNPDGYVYTWETDRYWYKNRQILDSHVSCLGLDTNRNWGYKWHHEPVEGALRPEHPVDPCSHWYPGSRPFESPEVNAIANYVITLPDVIGFLDLRSYGQMISTPYSYSCKRLPKDIEDQAEAAFGAAQAIKLVHGAHFEAARICENLYEAPGNILDWMYAEVGTKYAYAVHLRDTGTYGFSLPPKWIRPVGEESAAMVLYLGKFIAEKLGRKI